MGILACCIFGFITTNRFKLILEGNFCTFDRFYYDILYGQLKDSYPKWEGIEKTMEYLNDLKVFLEKNKNLQREVLIGSKLKKSDKYNYLYDEYFTEEYLTNITKYSKDDIIIEKINQITLPIALNYGKIVDSIYILNEFNSLFKKNLTGLITYFNKKENDFPELKSKFLDEFYDYAKIVRIWENVLAMICFCLLFISVIFTGISMIIYVYLKNKKCLLKYMHVLWNIIRFFIFLYFLYGAAYGISYLILRDMVAYIMFVFGKENLDLGGHSYLIPLNEGKEYLHYCLINVVKDYKKKLNPILTFALEEFFNGYHELKEIFSTNQYLGIYFDNAFREYREYEDLINSQRYMIYFIRDRFDYFYKFDSSYPIFQKREGGIFGFLNCSFLKSDLNMMYTTLYDLSNEAIILCILSCCIGFFGGIFVFLFLLVLYHYKDNNEIRNSIDSNAYENKKERVPSYKHKNKKIGNEPPTQIEMASINDENIDDSL